MELTATTPTARARRSWMHRPAPRLADTHPAPRVSDYGVGVPGRQEVEFKDGNRIWVLQHVVNGAPDLFLRELGAPATGTLIDLRKLIPDCDRELPTTSTRDVAGFVALSLRHRFGTLEAFLEAAVKHGSPAL